MVVPSAVQAADPELAYALALGSVQTGSGNFDAGDGPGNDSGPDNDIVRSFDSVTYELEASVSSTTGATGTASNAPNETPLNVTPGALSFATDNVTTPAGTATPDSPVS